MAASNSFQFPIYFMKDIFNRVYPFHMAKGMQAMRGMVNNCDCVIEVRDARVPLSSNNPQFEDLYANKPRIILMNKIDLADKAKTKKLSSQLAHGKYEANVLYGNCKESYNHSIKKMLPILKNIFAKQNLEKTFKSSRPIQSLNDRSYKLLVCGIPNVGKSSFINSARRHHMSKGGKATPVGKKPGVTKSVLQTITISRDPKIQILDTPGIFSPAVTDSLTGIKLALTGTFPDHVIGEEVIAHYLIYTLNQQNNTRYVDRCGLSKPTDNFDDVVNSIAVKHNWFIKDLYGVEPDYRKCSIMLIQAFRDGSFGRVTLDT